ncbi:MAG: AAA family ATPase, partial [Armatimonadota bacterium]
MYLKKLQMRGFKSFADNTELEFGPGITAVVGPNGVGKSNISDAVLWAMGEQSYKTLRSTSSQDLIFAGSDDRRPLSMAEVSLNFENSDGRLPTEYSE